MSLSPDRVRIYAAFIGDGYLYEVDAHDNDCPESAGYWYSLRNAEVDCPVCNGGMEPPRGGCRECEGTGVTTGDAFAVARYEVPPGVDPDDLVAAIDGGGDGYERADILRRHAGEGTTVLEWEPERDWTSDDDDDDDDDDK
jgi:DnaJ-class molecular chaperone